MPASLQHLIKNLFVNLCMLMVLSFFELHSQSSVRIAVASNVSPATKALMAIFTQQTGIRVEIISGASGKLATQIEHGAPYDIFLSADTIFPNILYEKKLTRMRPRLYAQGQLVAWSARPLYSDDAMGSIDQAEIRHIAIADPALAPYGKAAMDAMKKSGQYERVKDKLIFGENISQVNQYITTGTADIGLTALSSVLSAPTSLKGYYRVVDSKLYNPIIQSAALLSDKLEARQCFEFIYSDTAKEVFVKFGYTRIHE